MPTVIQHRVSGYLDTNVDALVDWMQHLLSDPEDARRIGQGAKATAETRFGIGRFARDWDRTLTQFVADRQRERPARSSTHTHTEVLR
jgi:glycosyltransferase involved in cell wall biosynthesis